MFHAAVDIRDSPTEGKGLEVFAETDLPAGTLLLEENIHPTLVFRTQDEATLKNHLLSILQHNLPFTRDLLELSHLAQDDDAPRVKLYSIYLTNSLILSSDFAFLSLNGSRFNHSCLANATWTLDTQSLYFCVRLTRAVTAGEEITINYCKAQHLVHQRAHILNERYGFYCQCEACVWGTPFFEESQVRRTRMQFLEMQVSARDFRQMQNGEGTLRALVGEWKGLIEMERVDESLDNMYGVAELAARQNGYLALSRQLAGRLLRVLELHTGANSSFSMRVRSYVEGTLDPASLGPIERLA